jgi:hypothetical protein
VSDANTPTPATTPAQPSSTGKHPETVVVRAYPKVVFFWLTWIVSLVAAIIEQNNPGGSSHLGTIWMAVFAFNMMVIAFDFTEVISLLLLATIAVVVFAGLYFGFLSFIGDWLVRLHLHMDASFYYTMFGLFTVIYLFVFIKTRFDYWEFRHNEVIHRRGVFADLKRYSTEDLRWFKEVPDVLERVICGSGRMILTTPREQQPIIIEHVLGISRIDEKVADILGVKRVTMG